MTYHSTLDDVWWLMALKPMQRNLRILSPVAKLHIYYIPIDVDHARDATIIVNLRYFFVYFVVISSRRSLYCERQEKQWNSKGVRTRTHTRHVFPSIVFSLWQISFSTLSGKHVVDLKWLCDVRMYPLAITLQSTPLTLSHSTAPPSICSLGTIPFNT